MRYLVPVCVFAFLLASGLGACKKKINFSMDHLNFSTDTLVFDTVFTTIGSTTKNFKFYNPSKAILNIEEIELMGGESSPFRINIDGIKGHFIRNIEMEGKDSLFAFIEVTLSVNSGNLPMIVEDRIRFRSNGKDQFVQLAVWGQDAYFHYNDVNEGTWPSDKPHVIYGFAGVDSATVLEIQAGTQIHLHKNSLLFNYKGTININGTKDNKVVIQGDRLELSYSNIPGQYYGVYFQEARPSVFEHVEVKNGIAGIHLFSRDEDFNDYTLTLRNSELHHHSRYGLFIFQGARVKVENTIIHKNTIHAMLVLGGGDFNLNYCNLLGYASQGTPAVGISNFYSDPSTNTTTVSSINEGTMTNCIITGNQPSELAFDTLNVQGVDLSFQFKNCLIALENIPTSAHYQNTIWNADPAFVDIVESDYSYFSNSPLHGAADDNFYLPFDFFVNGRVSGNSDIGAIEIP
ncbi:MAG: hypothetical protein ACI9XP_000839 [Lentimonas sp.]|jgi:hypothetical protein